MKLDRLGDRIFCLFNGHEWWNINNLPRFVTKNNQLVKEYDEPRLVCLACGVEKK